MHLCKRGYLYVAMKKVTARQKEETLKLLASRRISPDIAMRFFGYMEAAAASGEKVANAIVSFTNANYSEIIQLHLRHLYLPE